jgi:1,4-alpha-glucan branching enzyme
MAKTAKNHFSLLTDHDIYLFKEGNHFKLYEKLGSHSVTVDGREGTYFALWAPNAKKISVTGDFNEWNKKSHQLTPREDVSGIWEGFIPGMKKGDLYKYHIVSRYNNYRVDKGDPFAFYSELSPKTASVIWDLKYTWNDDKWMAKRHKVNAVEAPYSIYEVHIGSWRRVEKNDRFLSYREIAHLLAEYVKDMGFTHVELLPIMEHPFYGSWGYQTVGYFAPTSRFGTPQDFMYMIDHLHKNEIGVILDWVPSHFPSDEHGLSYFDGTYLYEHEDPKKGFHPEWKSYIFNYSRNEVRNFLISSALFWLDKYHIDGIRVDAVASMLYLDYARKHGEWIPNKHGGNEDLDAISFLKRMNEAIYSVHPDVQTIAEESTAWPMVSKPVYVGGLGFGMKWNMGWMHDTLKYLSNDPVHRKYHHDKLTFSIMYAFSENFVLPLSHDEVVHGKGSLHGKMPGDEWQKNANLRTLFGYMYGHPGKKLLFMGGEFGQWKEWNHDDSLEWHGLEHPSHKGLQNWVKDLNHLYRNEGALHELDFSPDGFQWIDFHDWGKSVISFIRRAKDPEDFIVFVFNFTPVPRYDYIISVPRGGLYKEILNSDSNQYGGSNLGNFGAISAKTISGDEDHFLITLNIPPLGTLILRPEKVKKKGIKKVKKKAQKKSKRKKLT